MTDASEATPPELMYASQLFESTGVMQIVLRAGFTHENWPELQEFCQTNLSNDAIHFWDLDLRQVPYINSMLLGLLVGFNAVILNRGAEFRLLVAKGSKTAEIIYFSKINRIINVRES